jgi:hypothetical protein
MEMEEKGGEGGDYLQVNINPRRGQGNGKLVKMTGANGRVDVSKIWW